jgi:hypothetical protein
MQLNRQSGAAFIFDQVGLAPIPFEGEKTCRCCAIIDLELASMFAFIRELEMNANGLLEEGESIAKARCIDRENYIAQLDLAG